MHATTVILLTLSLFCSFVQVRLTTLNKEESLCVEEMNLDRSTIETFNIEPVLPEDNDEIKKYMACYWKKLGYQLEDGQFNYLKISEDVHSDLKHRFRSECLHIAAYVVDTCRNKVNGDSDGLKAVRMWNCLSLSTENLF